MAQSNAQRLINLGFPAEQAKILEEMIAGGGSGDAVSWGDIQGKPSTFTPTIGTTATTAKAGDYAPAWGDVTGKPTVIAAGADAAAARTAIGAGTSNLTIGTTASTAKAGNAVQTATQTTATAISPGTATDVQGILAELAQRITDLELAQQ